MDDCPLADAIRHNRMTPSGRTGEELMWLIFDDMAALGRPKEPRAQNIRDGFCGRGHEMTPENTYYPPGRSGRCRECIREAGRAFRKRRNR